jgi:hypothetical protein
MDDGPFDPSFYPSAKCQIANLDILKVCTVKGFKNSDRYHNCIHYHRAHVKNTTVLLQGSRSSSSRIVLYSVSFQIENDSMATPMKAAAAAKGQLISKCIFGVFNLPL